MPEKRFCQKTSTRVSDFLFYLETNSPGRCPNSNTFHFKMWKRGSKRHKTPKSVAMIRLLQNSNPFPDTNKNISYFVRRLLALAKPEFWYLFIGTLSLLVSSISSLALPWYIGDIFNSSIKAQKKSNFSIS